MELGAEFPSFQDLSEAVKEYSKENKVVYVVGDCRTVNSANERMKRTVQNPTFYKDKFKYAYVKFVCKHFGDSKTKSTGQRPNQRSYKIGCKSFITASVNRQKGKLVVTKYDLNHNHEANDELYKHYPEIRRTTPEEVKTVCVLSKLGVTPSSVCKYFQEMNGKCLTVKDVRNIRIAGSSSSDLQKDSRPTMPKKGKQVKRSHNDVVRNEKAAKSKRKIAKTNTEIKTTDLVGTKHVEVEYPFKLSSADELFASFISPCSVSTFFEEYWEQKPMLLAHRADIASISHYLFSKQILEDLTEKHELDFVRDVCVSRYRNEKRESLNGDGRMTLSDLKKLMMKKKATIQFHQPQRFQEILWRIMEHLETKFDCLVGANVYITPGGSQGLAPHYDDVEVFILQLEGEKRWRLYETPQKLPRNYSQDLSQSDIGEPLCDLTLNAGDMLYFPRGTVHQAATPEYCSHSTHITFSTYQHNAWADYLLKMLNSAFESNVNFRRGLPQKFLSGHELTSKDKSVIQNLILGLSHEVTTTHQQTIQEMRLNFMANRLPPYRDIKEVEEIQLPPKGHRVTHMRLKYPGHTCVVVEGPSMDTSTRTRAEDRATEGDGWVEEDADEEEQAERNGEEDDDEEESDEEMGESQEDHSNGHRKRKDVFKVYHSLGNDRKMHMMTTSQVQPAGYTFSVKLLALFRHLEASNGEWVSVDELSLDGAIDGLMFGDIVECKYGK